MTPATVRIVEVGPRDGLQNEAAVLPTELKVRFIVDLAAAGLREIEAGSFVSPTGVPAMADSDEVFHQTSALQSRHHPVCRWALVPNARGVYRAQQAGARAFAFFTAASPAFVQRNLNTTLDEQIPALARIVAEIRAEDPEVRLCAYVSTAIACPFTGPVAPSTTVAVANRLITEVGITEISLGETIGVAVPREVDLLARHLVDHYAGEIGQVRWHFHDTHGTALANVARVLEWGSFGGFDASAGGLGGCPFAPGATGNLATEDLVYFLERQGIPTGVNLPALARASLPVLRALGRVPASRAQQATLAKG